MTLTRTFAELTAADVAIAGGKGANLGEMLRAGLPVPPGFVLLTDAYRAFVTANGLQAEIERLATGARPSDPASLDAASAAIRALFSQGRIPDDVRETVSLAYRELGAGLVAVRSSATAEDLPGASFAGQQETYLNIDGDEAVLAATQRCWSSLWTPRAIAYRANHGIEPAAVTLAVVVQRLVTADLAGILFTANPVNGRRDQMVIDGAWGLGEAVVSGQVTPDHWVAAGATGAISEQQIARKEVMTVRTAGGTELRPVSPDRQEEPVLDAAGVAALVDLGRMAAVHFGCPQDLEWAFEGGRFYLVQSRPITSLFPLPSPVPPAGDGLHVYLSFMHVQGLVDPFTPMGISLFQILSKGISWIAGYDLPSDLVPATLKVAGGRIWLDATRGLHHHRFSKVVRFMPQQMDPPMSEILEYLLQREPELAVDPKGTIFRRINFTWASRMGRRVLRALFRPDVARDRGMAEVEAGIARMQAEADRLTTLDERVRYLVAVPAGAFPMVVTALLPQMIVGAGSRFLSEAKLKEWTGDTAGFQAILRSLPHNPTTQMDLDLWRVSRRLKAEGAAPSASHPAVREFLARYGHRAAREIDAGVPRWSDEPDHILNVLQTYIEQDEAADPIAKFEQGAAEAEQAVAEIIGRVRRTCGPVKTAVMRFLLRRARALMGTRERPKFNMVRIIALYRRVLRAAGEDLVQAGRLDRADDVFFLDLHDLQNWRTADLRAIVAANRAEYDRDMARRSCPRILTSTGEAFYAAPAPPGAEGSLRGTAASAGVYEGVVRVVHDPVNSELQEGEVLVAPATDPAWTPLFLTAGALVMEIGGPMSHGSVVAREYGIPAVVGVPGATKQLKTGQRVRVDGESGTVTPLDP